jgi:tubulin monoglycylase TTLL3/8
LKSYYEAIGEDPFISLPVTFHVKAGLHDPEFHRFKEFYNKTNNTKDKKEKEHNIWIIKPGECTNCGIGIQVAQEYESIQDIV